MKNEDIASAVGAGFLVASLTQDMAMTIVATITAPLWIRFMTFQWPFK